MPCIEPTTVYAPARDTWADNLAHLAMVVLSKITDGHRAGHYVVPRQRPIAIIEIQHEKRLEAASETMILAVGAIRELVTEANTQFVDVFGVLTKSKNAVETRKKFDSDYAFAAKGGVAVDCDEVERYWRCLSVTMNAIQREHAHMLCAIEKARSSYIHRQVCPEDPCDDCDRKDWVSYPDHPHGTPVFHPSDQETEEKPPTDLDECEDRLKDARSERDKAKEALDNCEQRYAEAEKRWKEERDAYQGKSSEQNIAQSARAQAVASDRVGQSAKRKRKPR